MPYQYILGMVNSGMLLLIGVDQKLLFHIEHPALSRYHMHCWHNQVFNTYAHKDTHHTNLFISCNRVCTPLFVVVTKTMHSVIAPLRLAPYRMTLPENWHTNSLTLNRPRGFKGKMTSGGKMHITFFLDKLLQRFFLQTTTKRLLIYMFVWFPWFQC